MEDIVEDFLTDGTYYSLSELSCGGVPPKVSGSDLSFKIMKSVKIYWKILFSPFAPSKPSPHPLLVGDNPSQTQHAKNGKSKSV